MTISNNQPPSSNRYAGIIGHLQHRRYAEAEREAIRKIRQTALHPQGWTLLGEALLHQGFGSAARLAFDRAWLLDPQADWVGRVRRHLGEVPGGPERGDIRQLLQTARPTVAIGIIAKDEERTIARCLSSLRGAADEIVLVDSGSTDRTLAIAAEFPEVKIVHATWRQSFAELRNEGLRHMNADWVLWIDADEYLHEEDVPAVREVAGLFDSAPLTPILYIWQVNQVRGMLKHEFSQARMFPLRRGLSYHGRVHEQIGPANGDSFTFEAYRQPVRIRLLHDGYEPSVVAAKNKLNRNLELLAMMTKEQPEHPGWWLYYARESLAMGFREQASAALERAEAAARYVPSFARLLDIYMLTAKLHAAEGNWNAVEEACDKALALHPDFPDALFYRATAKLKQGYALYREAEANLKQSKLGFSTYRGTVSPDHEIGSWKADASIADIARAVGRFGDAALIYHQLAEQFPQVDSLKKPKKLIDEQRTILNKLYD
ncbi:Glycosyltransferase involved in cell wall bisynthesis [Paenibacillus sp. UNCCL117]|uniref:glycosyltransferase family 2 protein n=1 Tax=unclassified Paenibacillus TaxID=185978 RepID=UPI000890D7F0|nr:MULTISPECIES: glycosyltransferase family 2 protein [unclassified Paenibacillus]SDC50621.1 Glycosyltransferase involved in cell wall bisynthesis [Paenibacillus sp. cl123]SFW11580.1 Glycosyltransferase involved in cell wall bisynthesis [Paenibacillus sp. UNCCL117]